jgi:23S rRNA pseudouridine1911/1915/1917 synthase
MLEAQPKTGRTHQIRIHLAAIGHPIVGDVIYGKEQIGSFRPLIEKHGLPFDRHCLHASSLRFNHPRSGESLAFSSQLPDDWPAVVEKIRAAPTRSVQ